MLLYAGKGLAPGVAPSPMAVLVQPEMRAGPGGIMFGVDPLTGRPDRLVVVASADGPQRLVSGEDSGVEYVLTSTGRPLRKPPSAESILSARRLRALAQLASRAKNAFGAPQDVEWALDGEGALVLFQSRPVTPVVEVLGPQVDDRRNSFVGEPGVTRTR